MRLARYRPSRARSLTSPASAYEAPANEQPHGRGNGLGGLFVVLEGDEGKTLARLHAHLVDVSDSPEDLPELVFGGIGGQVAHVLVEQRTARERE